MNTATAVRQIATPTANRIIVRPLSPPDTTPGGIALPDTAKDSIERGNVCSIGPGRVLENGSRAPMDLEVGDIILFNRYAATEITLNGDKLLLMTDDDALATIEDSDY